MQKFSPHAMALAIGLCAVPISVIGDTSSITIRVVDADKRVVGVPSEIVKHPPKGGEKQGRTGKDGRLRLTMSCITGTRIRAEPISPSYSYSRSEYCKNKSEILLTVTSIAVASHLVRQLADAVASKDLGIAAHLANELSWMSLRKEQGVDGLHVDGSGGVHVLDESLVGISVGKWDGRDEPMISDGKGISGVDAEALVYGFAAQKLGIAQGLVFDPGQGRNVMTEELRDAVRKFQRNHGLHSDGILGYSTLHKMSGKSSRSLRIDRGTGISLPQSDR